MDITKAPNQKEVKIECQTILDENGKKAFLCVLYEAAIREKTTAVRVKELHDSE